MKTIANNTQTVVKLPRMVLYLSFVIILAFLNCLIVRAGEPETGEKSEKIDDTTQLVTSEIMGEEPATENRILELSSDILAETAEEQLRFEAWMFNLELLSGPVLYSEAYEEELEIEPWMLTISRFDLSDLLSE